MFVIGHMSSLLIQPGGERGNIFFPGRGEGLLSTQIILNTKVHKRDACCVYIFRFSIFLTI